MLNCITSNIGKCTNIYRKRCLQTYREKIKKRKGKIGGGGGVGLPRKITKCAKYRKSDEREKDK